MQSIKIESIQQDDKKVTLIEGSKKYGFWRTKKDGGETKAFSQYKKYGFQVGDSVNAEIKEEPATFTDPKGKEVNYTRRTILYFQEIEDTPVFNRQSPQVPVHGEIPANSQSEGINERLRALEARVYTLEAEAGNHQPF